MELQHLRSFIEAAEQGRVSVTVQRQLRVAKSSLSRHILELEKEVGTVLLSRTNGGVELTDAGTTFLSFARSALLQADAAIGIARRATSSGNKKFALGLLDGYRDEWLREIIKRLQDQLPTLELAITSQASSAMAQDLRRGMLHAALMYREEGCDDLEYIALQQEPLVAVMTKDHRLARRATLDLKELAPELSSLASITAQALQAAIERGGELSGYQPNSINWVVDFAMALAKAESGKAVTLLPAHMAESLGDEWVSRTVEGAALMFDVVIGYKGADASSTWSTALARLQEDSGLLS